MAVILKKQKVRAPAGPAALASVVAERATQRLTPTAVVTILGGLVLVAGMAVGLQSVAQSPGADAKTATPTATAESSPKAESALAKSAEEEVASLGAQASKLVAALLAYKQDTGLVAPKVQDLAPRYLATSGTTKAWLNSWEVSGFSLERAGISEQACRLLSNGKLSPIDHGRVGMQCISEKGAHRAVYRIDEAEPPRKGFWKLSIAGKLSGKLSVWSVVGAPSLVDTCEGHNVKDGKPQTQWDQALDLTEARPSAERTLCLPAYAQEVSAMEQGMSLLEGGDSLQLASVANEEPWVLTVSAQACDFGKRATGLVTLHSSPDQVAVPKLSCDLRKM